MSVKIASKCLEGNNETSKQKFFSYCFTSFEEKEPPFVEDKIRYICYSPEICPTSGRKHWQGFIYLHNQMTITAIQKYFQKNYNYQFGFLKNNDGTAEQNRIYCGYADYEKDGKIKKKNEAFKEFGVIPIQGKRTDLISIKDKMVKGELKLDDVILNEPITYHQYGRTLKEIQRIVNKKKFRNWMTEGIWYYGKTGTGKSHRAFENFNPEKMYVFNVNDGGFWNGYEGHEIVIINEFRGQIPFSELLDLIDKHPKNVKIKGSDTVPFLAKKVIITSSKHPKNIYINALDDEENFDQLERRIKIIELKEKYIVKEI